MELKIKRVTSSPKKIKEITLTVTNKTIKHYYQFKNRKYMIKMSLLALNSKKLKL